MKLHTTPRAGKKSEVNKLRREGFIPAVLYVKEKEGETLAVNSAEFAAHIRQVTPGHLPTTVFVLHDSKGKERRAIVKEIQYNITTYDVIHLDFEELSPNHQINVKVPIECTGINECAGIKLGGVLRQVIRHVLIRCLPKDLPSFFTLDIRELALGESKRMSALDIPESVRLFGDPNQVVAAIVKR